MIYRGVQINKTREENWNTAGLPQHNNKDIVLKSCGNEEGEIEVLKYIIDYIINEQPIILDNETIAYGLWLLQFRTLGNHFVIYELDNSFENWEEGTENAAYYMQQQKEVCQDEGVTPNFPKLTQNLAMTTGVIEGGLVKGIRYNEPDHMCGWYLTSNDYSGNIEELEIVNIQAIIKKRKDLLQFLALPPGFIFEITERQTCHIYKAPLDPVNN